MPRARLRVVASPKQKASRTKKKGESPKGKAVQKGSPKTTAKPKSQSSQVSIKSFLQAFGVSGGIVKPAPTTWPAAPAASAYVDEATGEKAVIDTEPTELPTRLEPEIGPEPESRPEHVRPLWKGSVLNEDHVTKQHGQPFPAIPASFLNNAAMKDLNEQLEDGQSTRVPSGANTPSAQASGATTPASLVATTTEVTSDELAQKLVEEVEKGAAGRILSRLGGVSKLSDDNVGQVEKAAGALHGKLAESQREKACIDTSQLSKNQRKRLAALEQAAATGKLDPQSYMGQFFRDAHREETEAGAAYHAASTQRQAEIRNAWLMAECSHFKSKFVYKKGWKRVDVTKGKYLPIGRIVHLEGGYDDKEAVAGVMRLVASALCMGEPWVVKHPQTKRLVFLYLEISFSEIATESWEQYKTEMNQGKLKDAETKQGTEIENTQAEGTQPEGTRPEGTKATEEAKAAAKSKGKASAKRKAAAEGAKAAEGVPETPAKKQRTDSQIAWTKAMTFRKDFLEISALATNLIQQIDTVAEWEWARTPSSRGEIQRCGDLLRGKLTPFMLRFVTENPMKLKKDTGAEVLNLEVRQMGSNELSTAMAALKNTCEKLVRRHNA